MGKRSNFARVERDFYPTPKEAVKPLLPHLPSDTWFIEPCCGEGNLIEHLKRMGHHCVTATDINGRAGASYGVADAKTIKWDADTFDYYVTNPPWDRNILHPIIQNLSSQNPTWLLFDADWMHTRQSAPYLHLLRKIVSVGRVKWIPDSKMTGKDNCCWYLFDAKDDSPTVFFGRTPA